MASMQIPLAIWKESLDLDVSFTLVRPDEGWIFLGLRNGRILELFFDLESEQPSPRLSMIMVGHQNSIVGLELAAQKSDQSESLSPVLLSLDRNGEVALWSVDDGRCLLHNVMAIDGEARGMRVAPMGEFAFVYGHTPFVNIIRISTLEVVQSVTLPSLCWISSAAVLQLQQQVADEVDLILFPVMPSNPIQFRFNQILGKAISIATLIIDVKDEFSFISNVEHSMGLGGGSVCFAESSRISSISRDLSGKFVIETWWKDPTERISYLVPGRVGNDKIALRLRSGKVCYCTKQGLEVVQESSTPILVDSMEQAIFWKGQIILLVLGKNSIKVISMDNTIDDTNGKTEIHCSLLTSIKSLPVYAQF